MNKFIFLVIGTLFFITGLFAQTGWTTNPPLLTERVGEPVYIKYVGALDTLGQTNDTLRGMPISLFNKYGAYTWLVKYKFIQAGDCTTSVFIERSEDPSANFSIMATDTVRNKGVTKDTEYYIYPLFMYNSYRNYYRPVVINESGGRDSTWFEIEFIGYPQN